MSQECSVKIPCEYSGLPASLSISFSAAEPRSETIQAAVRLVAGVCSFEYEWTLLRDHIVRFIRETQLVHELLAGEAFLGPAEYTFIRIRVGDRAAGTVLVDGAYSHDASWTRGGAPISASVRLTFGPLILEQSYLPGLARSVADALEECFELYAAEDDA